MNAGFELRSLSKAYGGHCVLADISLTILRGESFAIIGPSGCGKSTMLRLLAGLEVPGTGQILLDGVIISDAGRIVVPPHRRGVAMVFQDLALWPNLSVLENVLFGLSSRALAKSQAHRRAMEALELCRIEALANRKPGRISGGQQQRVALARAVACQPDFLFLDEPFSGLDLVTRTALLKDISDLADRKGCTVVLVSHEPFDAMALCRSAVALNQGQVEEKGELIELLQDPKSEILRVFKDQMKGHVV